MMREMKDHELELVVGGRNGGGLTDGNTVQPDSAKFTEKHLAVPAKAAPFLMPENQTFTRPPKNLPGAGQKQPRKGGPFTFKTPYLNR